MRQRKWIYLGVFALALSGCFTAGVDTTQFYVLAPHEVQAKPTQDAVKHFVFASLELPELLNTSKIASRFGSTQIYYESEHRWAASLRSLIQGAIEDSLHHHGCLSVNRFDATLPQLHLDIKHFEAGPQDEVVLVAQWTVSQLDTQRRYQATLTTPYTLKSYDYPALTQAMAATLRTLSQRIAASL